MQVVTLDAMQNISRAPWRVADNYFPVRFPLPREFQAYNCVMTFESENFTFATSNLPKIVSWYDRREPRRALDASLYMNTDLLHYLSNYTFENHPENQQCFSKLGRVIRLLQLELWPFFVLWKDDSFVVWNAYSGTLRKWQFQASPLRSDKKTD